MSLDTYSIIYVGMYPTEALMGLMLPGTLLSSLLKLWKTGAGKGKALIFLPGIMNRENRFRKICFKKCLEPGISWLVTQ